VRRAASAHARAGRLRSVRLSFRRWRWTRPSPQHAGALPASGVTSLQVARSLFGDFLEFVPNAAIQYRFARPPSSLAPPRLLLSGPLDREPLGLASSYSGPDKVHLINGGHKIGSDL
jgi:predicted dehydrogenase